MAFRVEWTEEANSNLIQVITWIQKSRRPMTAKKIYKEIRKRCRLLADFPYRGRTIPELHSRGMDQHRELIYSRWRIFYRIDAQRVLILAVLDSSREAESFLTDLGLIE